MEKGKLIVICGTDGSGKHTQTDLLKKNLEKEGYDVKMISFPQYGEKSAGPVEEYLNGHYGDADNVDAYQGSILYAVDRFSASFKIREWINQGKIVLCDRYVSANMGHQAGKIEDLEKRDKYLEWLDDLEFEIFKIPRPDLNIFLYMPFDMSRKLALKVKKKNIDKSKDIHENDAEHMRKASLAYKYVSDKFGWQKINCCNLDKEIKSREQIAFQVLEKVKKIL